MRWLVAALAALAALGSAAAASPDLFPGEDIFPLLPIAAVSSNNPRCREDSQMLVRNLHNSTAWAMRMWDASAKSAVGALAGNVFQMGDFDECVTQVHPVRAQYCLATVTVSLRADAHLDGNATKDSVWDKINHDGDPTKIRRDVVHWALCVPASCSHTDVEASVNLYLASAERNNSRASISVEVGAAMCQTNRQEEQLSAGAIAYCVVLALLVVLVIVSTVLDFRYRSDGVKDKQNNAFGYLLCFSMRQNFQELALPEASNHRLDCIYGLRVLTVWLVIIAHRVNISVVGPIQNYEFIERQYSQFHSVIFYKADILVDIFFVISGLLVTYILCLALDRKKVNPLIAIAQRYVRLTPLYAVVLFFYITLQYHMGDGPRWDLVMGPERDLCAKNWWTNLLYINNYVNDDELCMQQSWYLPCDTHFFVIALFVVMLLHKCPKTGMIVLGALLFGSALVPFLITFIGQKAPLIYFYAEFFASPRTHDIFQTMYTKSHTRGGPYFVGVATGYLLYRTRSHKKKYTWKATAGMAISLLVCCASLLPATFFYDRAWQYNVVQASLYAGFHRIAWAVGICGFVVAVVFSKSSMIGAVLSWSPMISLSKLVYGQFLVHLALQVIHLASIRSPEHINVLNVGTMALGDICWSLIISLALYLAVEAPVKLIAKRLMDPRAQVPKPATEEFEQMQKIHILQEDFLYPCTSSQNVERDTVLS